MPRIVLIDATRWFAWPRSPSSSVPGLVFIAAMLSFVVVQVAHAHDDAFPSPEGEIILTITGQIAYINNDGGAVFDETMLAALPPASVETTTVVTDGVRQFDGFLMRDLLALVGAEGERVTATALNDYIIDIPMEDFERFDVLVATHMDGQRLLPSDKGPLWIVYPRDDHAQLRDIRYDYRWVWQLVQLEVE